MSNPTAVNRPSFFKPLISKHYSTILRLPIGFVRKHRNILPENAKLRIRSGKIWTVKIEETDDDEECFFTDGWSDFVRDLKLRRMQMLLFWLNAGEGTFDVSVYYSSSNERDFSAGGESDGEEGEGDESRPRFQFVLTNKRASRMNLPKAFGGLKGKGGVVLQYPPREQNWAVVLEQRKPPQNTVELTAGWHDFVVENKLVLGRNYSFEFNLAKNLILVSECSSSSGVRTMDHTHTRSMNTENVTLKFVREVKEHHFRYHRMIIPKEFGAGVGKGGSVEVKNSRGRKWRIAIARTSAGFAMSRGLLDFFRGNRLRPGDIVLFESVANSVVRFVVVTDEAAGKEMLARSARGGLITT